jgi:hypothetical protein
MIKSILEKNIMSNNITSFKSHINKAPLSLLIKIIPFLCACGNLLMLQLIDSKINIKNLHNKENCMRMGLLTENFQIVNYLYPKNCMDESKILRYYICRGGSNEDIYNLLDKEKYWQYITENDIKLGIKNGDATTINFLKNKTNIPTDNYSYLSEEKHKLLLSDNNILNHYIDSNINIDLVLNELYERKQKNMIIFKSMIILKIFFIRIRNQIK